MKFLVKSKTVLGAVFLGVGLVDKMAIDFMPDTIAGILIAVGTALGGIGLRAAIEKLIQALNLKQPGNP